MRAGGRRGRRGQRYLHGGGCDRLVGRNIEDTHSEGVAAAAAIHECECTEPRRSWRRSAREALGIQFLTGLTSTKVQILTPEELRGQGRSQVSRANLLTQKTNQTP